MCDHEKALFFRSWLFYKSKKRIKLLMPLSQQSNCRNSWHDDEVMVILRFCAKRGLQTVGWTTSVVAIRGRYFICVNARPHAPVYTAAQPDWFISTTRREPYDTHTAQVKFLQSAPTYQ